MMSYLINTAITTGEPAWQPVVISFNATATPIPVNPGTVIWNPPAPGLIRAFTCNDDAAAPLVGNGGATQLAFGISVGATILLVTFANLINYSVILEGWGEGGPQVAAPQCGSADAGIAVADAGQIPGRPTLARVVRAFSNAGTITGTLRIRFEYRRFSGGTF